MKSFFTIVMLQFVTYSLCSQSLLVINGRILQKADSLPIFNAHIYIDGKSIGTTSNENGDFILNLKEDQRKEGIIISSIGFITVRKPIQLIRVPFVLYLEEDKLMLDAVTVTAIEPTQILLNVANNIKKNYPQDKFKKEIYYKEAFSVNGKAIRYLEIVADMVGKGFSNKKQNPYKYDLFIKEKRPGFNIDSTFEGGNGIGVLHWLTSSKRYLKKSNFKNYTIELVGYSEYRNHEVFNVLIKSKGTRKSITTLYITTDTYALVAVNHWYENDNREVPESMFYFTKWYEYVDFVQRKNGDWCINSINDFREAIDVKGNITEMKRLIRLTNVYDEVGGSTKNRITRETDLYSYPILYNPFFWDTYNAPPETDEEKRVKNELEKE